MWGFSKNFKYLDDLIRNGIGEIVLDSNIVLGRAEASQYPHGISVDSSIDVVIDGGGHTIDAKGKTRIFNCRGGRNITIKNITFKNGFKDVGGAIYNTSTELNIENCKFEGNSAVHFGGAVYNEINTLRIIESTFSKNSAKEGGAICNSEGNMYISDSTFKNNITQDNGALDNCDKLILRNVDFKDNKTKNSDYDYDVCNYEELHIDGHYSTNQQKSIYNEGCVHTSNSIDMIDNHGEINEPPVRDFTYLDDLINSRKNVVKLDYDIVLNCMADEDSLYSNGLKIHGNNLVIDGNGHTVDARGKTPIFRIYGNNVKIKNITLKNGESSVEGGAIMNEGKLVICNSKLCNNNANKNGGAIFNCRKLTVINCMFSGNGVGMSGGAIFNDGDLNVADSTFTANRAYLGSAILSTVEFDSNLKNCNFENKNNEVVYDNDPPW